MKDTNAQREDVDGLFRKFGGDAAAYKEFAPTEIPAATRPAAPSPPPLAPLPNQHVSASPPAAPVTTPVAGPAAEPLPVAANEVPVAPSVPRELDRLFARLDACAPVPAPAPSGLMAHWRRPG